MEYEQIYPRSTKPVYNPSDIVDFKLSFVGKSLIMNSIRLSGTLRVLNGALRIDPAADNVRADCMTGIHAFFNNFNISTANQGTLQGIQSYPRYVKMFNTANYNQSSLLSSQKSSNELILSDDTLFKNLVAADVSFAFMPKICLNAAAGNPYLSYNISGDVTVSVRINQVTEALYNLPAATFQIADLRLDYQTYGGPVQNMPVVMNNIVESRSLLLSNNTMINVKVPTQIVSASCSFLSSTKENSSTYNNTLLEMPTNINRVYFSFNNSTSDYVSYGIETVEDMIENYLDSLNSNNSKNCFTLAKLTANDAFGVGLGFGDAQELAQENFGVQIQSSASSTDQYIAYLYFNSPLVLGGSSK